MPITLFYKELNKLINEYYKCPFTHIKEQILEDIKLLTDALLLFDADLQTEISLKSV